MDSHEIKEAYRERMVKIYEKHNPSKVILGKPGTGWAISEFETRLSGPGTGVFFERFSPVQLRAEIDSLMANYVGQEHTMYLKICKKYSVTPEPEIKATAGGMGLHGAVDAINSVDFWFLQCFPWLCSNYKRKTAGIYWHDERRKAKLEANLHSIQQQQVEDGPSFFRFDFDLLSDARLAVWRHIRWNFCRHPRLQPTVTKQGMCGTWALLLQYRSNLRPEAASASFRGTKTLRW